MRQKTILMLGLLIASTTLHANRVVEAQYLDKISRFRDYGIEQSRLALSKSKNKEVEKIARKMVIDQSQEKKEVEKMRKKYYSDIKIEGTSDEVRTTNELASAADVNFDKLYLENMAKQHKEEILITSKMLPELDRNKVHHMAIKIVKKKGNEIDRLEKIKNSL